MKQTTSQTSPNPLARLGRALARAVARRARIVARVVAQLARNKVFMLTLGILISLAGLIWVIQGVQWAEVRADFANPALYLWAVPFVALTIAGIWLRGVRTYFLLRHEAPLEQWPLFKITMIGFCYNSIFPARAGEFIRAWLLGKQKAIGFARAAASLVVERLFDMIVILALFVLSLSYVPIASEQEVHVFGYTLKGGHIAPLIRQLIVLSGVVLLAVVVMLFEAPGRLIRRLIGALAFLPVPFRDRLCALSVSFTSGLRSIRQPGAVAWVVFLSFANWLVVAASVYVLQFGFPGLAPISMGQSMAITLIICFAVMLPSGPAYFGMYEAGGVFALLILGIVTMEQKSLAVSYVLAMHLLQIIPIIALGLTFALHDHVSLRRMREESGGTTERPVGTTERPAGTTTTRP